MARHLAVSPNGSLSLGAGAADFAADEGPPAKTCGWEGGAKTPFSYPLARRCHYFIITALTRRKRASTCPAIRSHLRRAGGGLTGDQRLPLPLPGCESSAPPVRRVSGGG